MGISSADKKHAAQAERGNLRSLGHLLRGFIDRLANDNRRVDCTASTLTVTRDLHDGKVITLNRAAGIAVTLPDANGSGARFEFIIGTTISSNSTTIKVPDANNVMCGQALLAQDGGDTSVMFEAGATADTVTMNGSTTGGLKGDRILVTDIGADLWHVQMIAAATGTEATPFSATVS